MNVPCGPAMISRRKSSRDPPRGLVFLFFIAGVGKSKFVQNILKENLFDVAPPRSFILFLTFSASYAAFLSTNTAEL